MRPAHGTADAGAPTTGDAGSANPAGPNGHGRQARWRSRLLAVASDDGATIAWPALSPLSGGLVSGDVRLGPPPGGDFVPTGSVGVGYRSPGYR